MTSSLVGSEMCIRDRHGEVIHQNRRTVRDNIQQIGAAVGTLEPTAIEAVSYTHLTLPTICSV
eukprot:12241034-Prorocentrum_lima.AAC.1